MKHDFTIIITEEDAILLDDSANSVSDLLYKIGKLIEKINQNDIEVAKDTICEECGWAQDPGF